MTVNEGLRAVAGAFVLLLLWIFYSTHLVLIGACVAREYADRFGSRVTRPPRAPGSRR